MDRCFRFLFKNRNRTPGWGMTLTAHGVTRPSRLELRLPMISNRFRSTKPPFGPQTLCRYHHKHLPHTYMPLYYHTIYAPFLASLGAFCCPPLTVEVDLDVQLKESMRPKTLGTFSAFLCKQCLTWQSLIHALMRIQLAHWALDRGLEKKTAL